MFVVSAGTSVLWWLYIDHRLYGNDTSSKAAKETKEEVEITRDSGQALLVYAVAATVFTVRKSAAVRNLKEGKKESECLVSSCFRSSCCC